MKAKRIQDLWLFAAVFLGLGCVVVGWWRFTLIYSILTAVALLPLVWQMLWLDKFQWRFKTQIWGSVTSRIIIWPVILLANPKALISVKILSEFEESRTAELRERNRLLKNLPLNASPPRTDKLSSDPDMWERMDSIGQIEEEVLLLFPRHYIRRFKIIPLDLVSRPSGKCLRLAVSKPFNLDDQDYLRYAFYAVHSPIAEIEPVLASETEIQAAIEKYYGKEEDMMSYLLEVTEFLVGRQ